MNHIVRPSLVLDIQKVNQNISAMCRKAHKHHLLFRPHFKTHQSAVIADLFRPYGIHTATVSSLSMAHHFHQHGWNDLTVAIPHNPRETPIINTEFSAPCHLGLLVDNPETISHLEQTLNRPHPIWIKIDCGLNRCGLPWDDEAGAALLSRHIKAAPKLKLQGLLTHAGHSYAARTHDEVLAVHRSQLDRIGHARALFSSLGHTDLLTSAGDTPCMTLADTFTGIDEIRPGNFVFFDLDQMFRQVCGWQDIALTLACPIVGIYPERNQVLIHGGAVHLSKEQRVGPLGRTSFGKAVYYHGHGWSQPLEADLTSLTQEHGILTFHHQIDPGIQIGGLIGILPIHSCLTAAPHPGYHAVDGTFIPKMCISE